MLVGIIASFPSGIAHAQDNEDSDLRRFKLKALIPVEGSEFLTLKADERIGLDGVSLVDPTTESSLNPGAYNELKLGAELQPKPILGITPRLTYSYSRVDYFKHKDISYNRHDVNLSLSAEKLGGRWTLGGAATALSLGGQHLVDNFAGGLSYSRQSKKGFQLIADYHFARTQYRFDRANSDLHQASLIAVKPIGKAGSYLVADIGISRQRAVKDQVYIFFDSLTDNSIDIDPAYRPYDYWGQSASLSLRLRNVFKEPQLTAGADLGYQRRRYSHVDYAIEPDNGEKRRDDVVNASAFIQYRLNRHLYARLTLEREDSFSNLPSVKRHGTGASFGLRWRFAT